ncbi:hypothetical protein N656DRAFT_311798, partial [Canariomyces notabilis]
MAPRLTKLILTFFRPPDAQNGPAISQSTIHVPRTRTHACNVMRGGEYRSVWGSDTRVVLGASPRQSDMKVADRVPLHLVGCHLRDMVMVELDKSASLSGRGSDVCDLSETLEERVELVLGDIAREAINGDSCVVGVRELVHGLHWVEGALVEVR